ncbi:exodeoxyribonuclease V subunit beta [Vibrio breoganii]|uniref:exodeoxyribonuclease V subunit beta n=1 Tax=Vibrio breoganii TaxID=553239 RepID=UPI000C81C1C9|nr:exodeoxyribonuclease V subunit beta [Vibrio breoganii]PML58077.1 exodeoxyribonuclease V subunit beta [Vibrio breoganii]PMO78371.1 exodeoxyribonuclease V subunit beta [Vibrio breoganii]PMO82790.1 exodeoxyribonuclease V subunit beta [Vibrio breoganii]PMO87101.1 exodeoxyribonuclease V subunit beta [Vibrio breoganii]
MTNDAQILPAPLETMTFPLHGARLIEASAGTGKTFTIAGLYLRLLLGHGDNGSAHQTPLTVEQILVVTFTEAATAELKDRIRARIHQARVAFSRGHSDDPVIKPLLEQTDDRDRACELLLAAERQMDEAAVYTIHGFCQRMLTQNAFESGSRFKSQFIKDETQLKEQVVADYWRRHFYGMGASMVSEIRSHWKTPQALYADLNNFISGNEVYIHSEVEKGDLETLYAERIAILAELQKQWSADSADFEKLIMESGITKNPYNKKNVPNWIGQIDSWAAKPLTSIAVPECLERFSTSTLQAKTKPDKQAPEHVVFDHIDEYCSLPDLEVKQAILSNAIPECRAELQKAKGQQQKLSFDDLLSQLDYALQADDEGLLSERIRGLYPVAMIDEFQDTDPQQYNIFRHLYLQHPECGLFMIGDPKQAIYAFRGADIFTYIRARKEVTSHFNLTTNWRSSKDMVEASNALFQEAESAFIYDDDIPFTAVSASPGADKKSWSLNGETQSAMTVWLKENEGEAVAKGDYNQRMAQSTATQIQRLLSASDTGNALLHGSKDEPIQAGNIAVLVRTGREANLVRRALSEKGVASVYLSNRDSVFASPVASDVLLFLRAALHFDNDRALRTAAASSLFDLSLFDLERLNQDEQYWELLSQEFSDYRQLWLKAGIMPMIRRLIQYRELAQRLQNEHHGERVLTDLMHLAELLQQASAELESDHALLRWFEEHIFEAGSGDAGDEQKQRLESEKNLVQVVTIHKSKGLEYDIIFVPFVSAYRKSDKALYYDAEQHRTRFDLDNNSEGIALSDKERLAEDLRLIYVAVTRAVYGCYLGVAPLKEGRSKKASAHLSAIGYLLQGAEAQEASALSSALHVLENRYPSIQVCEPLAWDEVRYQAPHVEQSLLQASKMQQQIDWRWRMTSYSGLVKQGHGSSHKDESVWLDTSLDIDASDDQTPLLDLNKKTMFNFPRGARPGTFLHTLFEEVEYTESAFTADNEEIIKQLLIKEQLDEEWLPVLQEMIDKVLNTDLDGNGIKLSEKQPQQRLVEMEFLLPIQILSAQRFNAITHKYDSLTAQAGDLGFAPVEGMLKGFIDLVFEHQGKYYVLDWKSNHLGDSAEDYHQKSLDEAMIGHRYDAQYQVYALALHRFLKSRVQDYSYETHFGGCFYLFVRGMDGSGDYGVFHAKPSQQMLEELDAHIRGEEAI